MTPAPVAFALDVLLAEHRASIQHAAEACGIPAAEAYAGWERLRPQLQAGTVDPETFWEELAGPFAQPQDVEARVLASFAPGVYGIIALKEMKRRGHPIIVVTALPAAWLDALRTRHDWLRLIDTIFGGPGVHYGTPTFYSALSMQHRPCAFVTRALDESRTAAQHGLPIVYADGFWYNTLVDTIDAREEKSA